MKVALLALNCSYFHTNLAVRCLRRELEATGAEVVILEFSVNDTSSAVLDALYDANADIYGFSTYIWNVGQMLSFASDIKKLRPSAGIVFGGPEVSYGTERFDGCDFIDRIICGSGEARIAPVCFDLAIGANAFPRIIKSLTPVDFGGAGILYDRDEETLHRGAMLYYESSRGCPFDCSYCLSSAERGVVCKSVEETLSDLSAFEALDGDIRIIKFVDRTFNFDIKRAKAIWTALLDEKYTKKYHFEVCASLLDEESFDILRRFPVGKIQLEAGLQSTCPETLAAVSRHLDATITLDAARRILGFGNIHIHLDLIAGLPYESFERFGKSFDEAYFCCDTLQVGFLKLLYGTRARKEAELCGYKYKTEPPYTALENNFISYSELSRLHSLSDLCERYRESGRFSRSIDFAAHYVASPFAFFLGLSDYIAANDGRSIRKIAQGDAFSLLYSYFKTLPCVTVEAVEQFVALLHADFSEHENRKAPRFN